MNLVHEAQSDGLLWRREPLMEMNQNGADNNRTTAVWQRSVDQSREINILGEIIGVVFKENVR